MYIHVFHPSYWFALSVLVSLIHPRQKKGLYIENQRYAQYKWISFFFFSVRNHQVFYREI